MGRVCTLVSYLNIKEDGESVHHKHVLTLRAIKWKVEHNPSVLISEQDCPQKSAYLS